MLAKMPSPHARNCDTSSSSSHLATYALKTLCAAVLATTLLSGANAAGLGRLTVLSALGQPLSAEIELTSVNKEEAGTLVAKLASAEAFRQAGIELNPAVLAMRFAVEQSGGRQFIRVTSAQSINEPYVDLLLELEGANGRLVREYTFLLDPANLRSAQVNAASSVQGRVPSSVPVAPTSAPAATSTVGAGAGAGAGASPAPGRSRPAAAPAAPKTTYQIKRGDSLTQIALQTRPAGVSLDQMLVALYRANPAAFAGENMNRMRTGEILTIPTADASRGTDVEDARGVVVAQTQDFNSYRSKLAGQVATSVPQRESEAKQSAAGKISSKVEEANNAAAESRDKLKLSKAGVAGVVLPKNASVGNPEDSIAKDKALVEANSRVRDLEKNVADLQKLLELKNKDLAEQQKKADLAAKPVLQTVPPAEVVPVTPTGVTPVAVPPPTIVEEKKIESPISVTPPIVAAPVEEAVAKPATPVPPVIVPAVLEASLIDRLVSNTYLLPGLGLLLVALGGFGILSSRRKKKNQQFENSLLTDSNLKTNSMFGSTGGASVDTNNSVFNSNFAPTFSQLDANEVDPVAEADVYIAYGRDAQAEEILKEALRNQPERDAVRLKLLEIYSNRKDVAAFELMATELFGRTKGEGEDWAQAASLGIALDPNNPMYAGGKAPEASSTLLAADLGAPTRPMEDLDLEALLAATQTNMTDPFGSEAPEPVAVPEDSVPPARATETPPVVDDGLDFDLAGFDLSPLGSEGMSADSSKAVIDEPAAKVADKQSDKYDELSMDFDVPELASNERMSIDSGTTDVIDFPDADVDVPGTPDPALTGVVSPASEMLGDAPFKEDRRLSADAPDPLDFDLSGISLDLDPDKSMEALSGSAALPGNDASVSVAGSEDNLLNEPEMATKLDLAIAYEEIGDKEGARELLDEVISGGSNEQVRQATAMRAKLG
ncbi:FimV/HubP family polar landmark protein [Actimicrobium sp. CCC2.4]|uniref:FimV/HubP family polar landmark protein n=1 Tax=Actimicrobium sp. CCC2.4 TaxID=3048606 RepID=UPI002AC95135|nr:FimV/HubP family polar landmark protein [Actimicrobium sp. CCC2.4]MEB0135670.1 FimV/HubP family polar landmark protein [Actimicrobium sp. CCC2.4]WPX33769.1 FimV/HubP family polar landmark protein [Actimicrobium sp. CCC2.4]